MPLRSKRIVLNTNSRSREIRSERKSNIVEDSRTNEKIGKECRIKTIMTVEWQYCQETKDAFYGHYIRTNPDRLTREILNHFDKI